MSDCLTEVYWDVYENDLRAEGYAEGYAKGYAEGCALGKTLGEHILKNFRQGMTIEDAIDHAVQDCIEENISADYLLKNRGEVLNMCLTEFNRDMMQGLTKTATAMLAKGFAPMVVAECTGLSLEQVMQLVPRS